MAATIRVPSASDFAPACGTDQATDTAGGLQRVIRSVTFTRALASCVSNLLGPAIATTDYLFILLVLIWNDSQSVSLDSISLNLRLNLGSQLFARLPSQNWLICFGLFLG